LWILIYRGVEAMVGMEILRVWRSKSRKSSSLITELHNILNKSIVKKYCEGKVKKYSTRGLGIIEITGYY